MFSRNQKEFLSDAPMGCPEGPPHMPAFYSSQMAMGAKKHKVEGVGLGFPRRGEGWEGMEGRDEDRVS